VGVTRIIHVGAPSTREDYIHRIGRTGRAGNPGESNLILAPFEKNFLKEIEDMPIRNHELPDSEIEVGHKESAMFKSAVEFLPPGIVKENFMSFLYYCISF
jgi:ATP-dependent RNA helicase MSS116, mitochondrial